MGNTYYSIWVDSQENQIADVKAALLDYYGAYNDPANLDGVDVLYDTSPDLIFTCTAIADKPLRLESYSANTMRPHWYYGSGYTAGGNVDDPVGFTGSYQVTTAVYAQQTEAHLILGPHTLLMMTFGGSRVISTLGLIGQITNGDYGVLGMVGQNTLSYNAGCIGRNTTDDAALYPMTLAGPFQSADGKLFRQGLILYRSPVGVELNGDGSIASFQDVHNASWVTDNATPVWGVTFVLTCGQMYMENALAVLPTCLLMEFEEMT